ncbi:MAG TPA: AbrB/MazE/SpoVT family DNA-binding domain-containing protein [Terracidiphilus sp.]|nr:AbrB/MazE/SpoVT family DNA-binding domain-containing protein [Terracidiphilus sp.]
MTDTVILGESGRIVLPVAIRKEFGLEAGERLTVIADEGEIRIFSRKMILDRVRARILEKRGTLKGILEEFLEERHEQARREAKGE